MSKPKLPKEFLDRLSAITAKRPKTVIDHILRNGSISTEELKQLGYDHPPRAARDVRELGIPLVTTRVPGPNGRMIAAYEFGNPDQLVAGLTGRTAVSKKFKRELIAAAGSKCSVCGLTFEDRYLQVDHRVPVEVGGDEDDASRELGSYMLLDGGCNRAKSWSCEHCPNFVTRDPATCHSCYWAIPDGDYEHVATVPERRVMLVWRDEEVRDYVDLATSAEALGVPVGEYLKERLRHE